MVRVVQAIEPVDDPDAFLALLNLCQLSQEQIDHLTKTGFTAISLFAHGCPDQNLTEDFVKHVALVPPNEQYSVLESFGFGGS